MLTATKSGNNIILLSSNTGSFVLSRKFNSTVWEDWDGTGWGGAPSPISSPNFTDYDLDEGVYQYRLTLSAAPLYDYSNCLPIGSDPVGWTFGNYVVPDGLFGEVLTSDDILYSFLWGIDLTAGSGQTWKVAQTQKNIEWAVYQLEKELNIDIFQRSYYTDDAENEDIEESKFVKKRIGYTKKSKRRYDLVFRHRPVREVTRFDFYSPIDTKIINLLPWMRLDRHRGTVNFYPKQGRGLSYVSYGWPWSFIFDRYRYRDAYHIDYTTGFKNAELMDEDLREIVGKITALKMLNVVGDGLLAGFSSSSISLDGLSESFSSTQSATSVGGSMIVRFRNSDTKIKDVYKNKLKFVDRLALSVDRHTNETEYKPCTDVYRHDVSKKKCYRIFVKSLTGEISFIDVTEDHSLFTPQMKEINGSDIKVGTRLRMMYSCEKKMRVVKIKRLFFVKYMYDLSVEKNENFTANGFVAHNSAYFGARIKVYSDDVAAYIASNKNKYGNFLIGSM